MSSRTERFERKTQPSHDALPSTLPEEPPESPQFTPEQEATLLAESNDLKALANSEFAAAKYDRAIETYTQALSICPNSLPYDRAVLKSNLAACYVKSAGWKDAVSEASECLDLLDVAEGKKKGKSEGGVEDEEKDEEEEDEKEEEGEEADEEIISPGAAKAEDLAVQAQKKKTSIDKIRIKALLRRGKARMELSTWTSLQGAQEDYQSLAKFPSLSSTDKKVVQGALVRLPGRIKVAQEKEMGEMWGKLKDLGNGILKPFGLSTDNFQMAKDEKTGGYSMNFNQGGAKS